jgi:intraflagellar transport protein 81
VDLREEPPEQTAIRMLSFLRVLKYRPKTEAETMTSFRNGLIEGRKHIIYPILEWLLTRLHELKKRAYLAKFLVKVEIPAEHLQDDQVAEMYQTYEELMEQFKETHKTVDQLRSSGFSAGEIRKDIGHMEDEREQLQKRIERLKKRVNSVSDNNQMLLASRNLRLEKEREAKMVEMKRDLKNQLLHADQRLYRTNQQLRDLKASLSGASAEGLLRQMEEENKVNSYMCHDKLPKEISLCRKKCVDMEQVLSMPALSESDLDDLQDQIDEVNEAINSLVEKKALHSNPADDKLAVFRQQASIIQRKKEAATESLKEAMDELTQLDAELKQKRDSVKAVGSSMLKAEEFDKYVAKLRLKSQEYKKKKAELAEMRAENEILEKTETVLKSRCQNVHESLSELEEREGVAGYRETQEELEKVSALKSELDEKKGQSLDGMSNMADELHKTILEKKANLGPMIRDVRPLRVQFQELSAEHADKKATYDMTCAGLESNLSRLDHEVRVLREEIRQDESRYHQLHTAKQLATVKHQLVTAELKSYAPGVDSEKKQTFRDMCTKKIQEQELQGKVRILFVSMGKQNRY